MDDNDFVIMDALFAEVKRLNADLQEEDAETEPDGRAMDRLTRIIEDGPISVLSVCQARVEDVAIWKEWSVSKDSSIEEALLRLAAYEDLGTVEELATLKEQAKWIPVSERLPEVKNAFEGSTEVLVAVKYKDDLRDEPRTICSGFYFQGDEWWTYTEHACGIVGDEPGHGGDTVTHWMPLPEAPKEADHE